VNIYAFSRSFAAASVLLGLPMLAQALNYGPLEIVGFGKDEFSICDNCSMGLVNPSSFDPRGVLNPPNPMVNQSSTSGRRSSNLALAQLTLGLNHEFDNAVRIEGKVSGRWRNSGPDIFGNYMTDLYAGISYPKFGSLQAGKMASRAWTRSDSFAYPMGLSSPWAESGAGYGVFPRAVRLGSRAYEIGLGKIRFEVTGVTATERPPLNPGSSVVPAPSPRLVEVFVQYSNAKNLVELIYQGSSGGRQSSFMKGAFYGAQGDTNGPSGSPGYRKPTQDVTILQGTYWRSPSWRFSYGIKRDEWSGQQQQCDYGPVKPLQSDCFWDQPGFNYASDGRLHHAIEWDFMGGVGYTRGLWQYTLGLVRMNRAYTKTPTEWGQSNAAIFANLGLYRKLPELSKYVEVYAGISGVNFDNRNPAPLGMPGNTAFGGVDPRISKASNGFTIGANFNF
jgi:hypothetical protein